MSGKEGINFDLGNCKPTKERIRQDLGALKSGYEVNIEHPCARGYSKIALLLSRNRDYHLLRQDGDVLYPLENGETLKDVAKKFRVSERNVKILKTKPINVVLIKKAGVWSHKRGLAYPPSLYDAKGKLIFDPRTSNFNYGPDLNYSEYCTAFCVKRKARANRLKSVTALRPPLVKPIKSPRRLPNKKQRWKSVTALRPPLVKRIKRPS
jgi:hypothetical protein